MLILLILLWSIIFLDDAPRTRDEEEFVDSKPRMSVCVGAAPERHKENWILR